MRRLLLFTLMIAALWAALFALVRRDSLRTRISAHGLLHVAIVEQCSARADVAPLPPRPPENPLFAGTPLPYYWFFHELAADVAAVTGLSPLQALEWLDLAAAAAAAGTGCALGLLLLRSRAAGATLATLLFCGAHPQGPLVLLARWLKHGERLFTRAGFAADGDYLWGLCHPALGALRIGDPYATLGPLASYFVNLTARPLALAALLVLVLMAALAVLRPSRLALLSVAAGAALCTLFSPITGLAGGLALAGGLVAAAWLQRRAAEPRLPPRQALELALAIAAGIVASLPWWHHLLGRGDAGPRFGLQPTRAVGVVAAGWLMAALAWCGLARFGGLPRTLALACLVAALPLLGATMLVALPVGNEDNFFHAALVLLSVPACGAVLPRPSGVMDARRVPTQVRRRTLLLHLAVLPTALIVLASYLGRPAVTLALDADGALVRTPADSAEASLLRWLRAEAPVDAIVVRDPGPRGRTSTGNTSELPALTGRPLFTDYADHYLVAVERDAPLRARLTRELLAAAPLAPADAGYLAALSRPLLLVADDVDVARAAALAERHGPARFAAGSIRVHAWSDRP